jgi:hypothetical protein
MTDKPLHPPTLNARPLGLLGAQAVVLCGMLKRFAYATGAVALIIILLLAMPTVASANGLTPPSQSSGSKACQAAKGNLDNAGIFTHCMQAAEENSTAATSATGNLRAWYLVDQGFDLLMVASTEGVKGDYDDSLAHLRVAQDLERNAIALTTIQVIRQTAKLYLGLIDKFLRIGARDGLC